MSALYIQKTYQKMERKLYPYPSNYISVRGDTRRPSLYSMTLRFCRLQITAFLGVGWNPHSLTVPKKQFGTVVNLFFCFSFFVLWPDRSFFVFHSPFFSPRFFLGGFVCCYPYRNKHVFLSFFTASRDRFFFS